MNEGWPSIIQGLPWAAATVLSYIGVSCAHRKRPTVWLSPMLMAPLALIAALLLTHTPDTVYGQGGVWLTHLLEPATVAFAVPLYRHFALLKRHASAIAVGALAGTAVAVCSTLLLLGIVHADRQLTASLLPRSVTTPFAVQVSEALGGLPSLTAVFVIVTGIAGTLLAPSLIRLLRIRSPVAVGVMLGMGAHGAGTALAYRSGVTEGTIATVTMIAAAFLALALIPLELWIT